MKIISIVGARPQFIKAAPVSKAIQKHNREGSCTQIAEILVHTGQHYDDNMSSVFFRDLPISKPHVNLRVGSGSHGWQTGQMLMRIEKVLLAEKPNWVLVYGDTNSTLAGAIAAAKIHIPLAHIEAGLRSFNREMPEELNRVLTDHCSNVLFCPTETAVGNLAKEGIIHGVNLVGDTMYDTVLEFSEIAQKRSTTLKNLGITSKEYILSTIHRPYNTDILENLSSILMAFLDIGEPMVFPIHPRTRQKINSLDRSFKSRLENSNVKIIDPVGYLDMLVLEGNAKMVITDSGGMQKEAYFLGVPCLTLRPETEWVETVDAGWNVLVGTDRRLITQAAVNMKAPRSGKGVFGDGYAGKRIVQSLLDDSPV